MSIKLYYSPISPPSRSVRMVMNILKLKVDLIEIDILSKSYLNHLSKINPQHTVPTVVDDGYTIWDSHAIAIYLTQKYGGSLCEILYPSCLKKRGIIHQRLHFDTGTLYPHVYNSILPLMFHGKTSLKPLHIAGIKQSYKFLELFLNKNQWLAGNSLTIADLCCIPTISTLDYLYPIKEMSLPNLSKYFSRAEMLSFYEECNQEGLDQLGRIIQEKVIRSKTKHED